MPGPVQERYARFTVAWQRPDQFHKVISTIGSFTDIRGGHVYPDLILQNDRKPIRIFLQDGLNTISVAAKRNNSFYNPKRDWHAQNIKMVAAFTKKGYDMNYCWGIGTHSNKQGGAMMPDMLRWLCGAIIRVWMIPLTTTIARCSSPSAAPAVK